MKKLFILPIITFISMTIYSQDTIPNNGFENWYSAYYPVSWETINIFLPPGMIGCERSEDTYAGNYAMQLQTVDVDGTLVPGVATSGQLDYYSTSGGEPFTARPSALKAFVKHPTEGDEIQFAVEFFKEGETIGGGSVSITQQLINYEEITIPLDFFVEESPDTVNVTILTDISKPGSSVLVDALSFDMTSFVENEIKNFSGRLFPNPCSGTLYLEAENREMAVLTVFSLQGKQVYEAKQVYPMHPVQLPSLPEGQYLVSVKSEHYHFQQIILFK